MDEYADRTVVDHLRKQIPLSCFEFSYARSSGPGGQNVNKVNTRVTLWFDLYRDISFNESQKRRLRVKLKTRLSKDGFLRVVSQAHRTQLANRRSAIERFYQLVASALERPKPRKHTRVPTASRKRRVQLKKERGQIKNLRRKHIGQDDD